MAETHRDIEKIGETLKRDELKTQLRLANLQRLVRCTIVRVRRQVATTDGV